MRSSLFAALLLVAIGFGLPNAAAAQDPPDPVPIPQPPPEPASPPPPPPPPPPAPAPAREVAVPRSNDSSPRLPEARVPGSDDGGSRNPRFTSDEQGGAVRRPSSGGSSGSGESSGTSGTDQSGAQRRGAVRRPSSEGSGASGGAVPRARSRATTPPRGGGGGGGGFYYNPYYNPYYSPYYSGYYDPWGYGAFGLGYFYYSPWSWSGYGAYGSAGYPQYRGAYGFDIGSVRLKVKPRDAEVWVDGYYAGVVDDFDGLFQSLKLDLGAYRIEIRKPGFATLQFDVRVQPDRTITYRSEMKPVP